MYTTTTTFVSPGRHPPRRPQKLCHLSRCLAFFSCCLFSALDFSNPLHPTYAFLCQPTHVQSIIRTYGSRPCTARPPLALSETIDSRQHLAFVHTYSSTSHSSSSSFFLLLPLPSSFYSSPLLSSPPFLRCRSDSTRGLDSMDELPLRNAGKWHRFEVPCARPGSPCLGLQQYGLVLHLSSCSMRQLGHSHLPRHRPIRLRLPASSPTPSPIA